MLLFYNQSMAPDDEINSLHNISEESLGDKENNDNKKKERTKTEMKITK